MESPLRLPNCLKCSHLIISAADARPYACTVFHFKTVSLAPSPAMIVYRTTGHHCPAFEPNPKIKE